MPKGCIARLEYRDLAEARASIPRCLEQVYNPEAVALRLGLSPTGGIRGISRVDLDCSSTIVRHGTGRNLRGTIYRREEPLAEQRQGGPFSRFQTGPDQTLFLRDTFVYGQ